jgi:hypothetical protein
MIKFFKKIRYHNIDTRKTGKYFTYAIGEIVLVVIGILIALNINNRNEHNKLVAKEVKILKEIKYELEGSLRDLDSDIKSHQRNLNSSKIISKVLLFKKKHHDSLNLHFFFLIDDETLTAKMSAFESLKSLGLEIISNDSIRQKITTAYLFMEKFTSEESEANIIAKKLEGMLESYIIIDREKFISTPKLLDKNYWGRKIPLKFINYNALLNNETFLLYVMNSIESRDTAIFYSQLFKKGIKEVISDITQELIRLEN